jgi:hypothetical protein
MTTTFTKHFLGPYELLSCLDLLGEDFSILINIINFIRNKIINLIATLINNMEQELEYQH